MHFKSTIDTIERYNLSYSILLKNFLLEMIKTNLITNAYPPFLIDKVIKKYFDYKLSSNQNQLNDKSDFY